MRGGIWELEVQYFLFLVWIVGLNSTHNPIIIAFLIDLDWRQRLRPGPVGSFAQPGKSFEALISGVNANQGNTWICKCLARKQAGLCDNEAHRPASTQIAFFLLSFC